MSNPIPSSRSLAAQLQGEDFPSMVMRLQKRIEDLERRFNQSSKSLSWNVTTPAFPATGVDVTNDNAVSVTAYIGGGTVTSVRIDGVTLNLTSGGFRVNPGDAIRVNYTGSPAWIWYGD